MYFPSLFWEALFFFSKKKMHKTILSLTCKDRIECYVFFLNNHMYGIFHSNTKPYDTPRMHAYIAQSWFFFYS
jgi:hypothetical protein